jgi:hypothetical protein
LRSRRTANAGWPGTCLTAIYQSRTPRALGMRVEVSGSVEAVLRSLARLAYEVPLRILRLFFAVEGKLEVAGARSK